MLLIQAISDRVIVILHLLPHTPYEGICQYHQQQKSDNNDDGTTITEVYLDDGRDLHQSRNLAESVDQVIVVVGYTHKDEGEYVIPSSVMATSPKAGEKVGYFHGIGGDRLSLKLLPRDEQLIEALAGSNDNLVVVCCQHVFMGG